MLAIVSASLGLLLLFLGSGIFVGAALTALGLILMVLFSDGVPIYLRIPSILWTSSQSFVLIAVPLFIVMGEILLHSGVAERAYRALSRWLSSVPGGLLQANIAACALFAAVSGSSVATAATIGSVAQPAFLGRGYNERILLGSLAAGGTLGILIPPSINMIVYAVMTDTSVGQLFMAGVIPGLMLALIYMLFIGTASILHPGIAPRESAVSWSERVRSLPLLLPLVGLSLVVLGTIYLGFGTPTEAAAIGAVGATLLAFAFLRKKAPRAVMSGVQAGAVTSGVVLFMYVGAVVLNLALASIGLPSDVAKFVNELKLPPLAVLGLIILMYIIMGMFMEALPMMLLTITVVAPIVFAAGFDPVWFGIALVVLMEMAQITPPVGMVLYTIQSIRLREGPIADVAVGILPFFMCQLIFLGLLISFPVIALWLPGLMFAR